MAEKICYSLIIMAVLILLLYVGISIKALQEIKEKLNAKETRCIRPDNGCDICCKDCQDACVCPGRCVHAKLDGEKDYGTDEL